MTRSGARVPMSVIDCATLHHACFVVRDMDRTARSLAEMLGVSFGVWTITPESCRLRGQDTSITFKVAIAQVGDSHLELLTPVSGQSVYEEHLREHGEGFHHTCLLYPTRAAMEAARDALLRQGRTIIQGGEIGNGGAFYYFDVPGLGPALEVLYLGELPPPERTIP